LNILVIDTSTEIALFAVQSKEKHYIFTEKLGRNHSTLFFEKLDLILSESGITVHDIDLIATGTGPGSFTGVRIAVSTARALAQTLKIPLMGIMSHEIFARGVETDDEYIFVSFDAKKKRVFAALYRQNNGKIQEIISPGDFDISEILEKIPSNSRVTSLGDGFEKYREKAEKTVKTGGLVINHYKEINFSPEEICRLIEEKYRENPEKQRDLNGTKPFYARKSDAETARDGLLS